MTPFSISSFENYFFGSSAIAIVFTFLDFLPSASAVPPFWQHEPDALVVPLLQQEPLLPLLQDFSVAAVLVAVVSHFVPFCAAAFSHFALSASEHFMVSCLADVP
jgi:hypothetical protein